MGSLQNCFNLLVLLVTLTTLNIQITGGNQAGRHTYVVRYKYGDTLIPVTVVLDYKRQTEYVINMNSRTPAKSVTLYDFKERVIAYKDLKNGECFIGRLTHETIHNEDAVLKMLKSPVGDKPLILIIDNNRPSLTPTEVRNMAGHKAAVFCRRMNTWTLLPEREKRRERRDTLGHLDRISPEYEERKKSSQLSHQRNELFESENSSAQRNSTTHRVYSNQPMSDHLEAKPSLQRSTVGPSNQHQTLPSVYPFILPRQRSVPEQTDDRKDSRENISIPSVSRKIPDDSHPQFSFVNGRSGLRRIPEFSHHLLPSGMENGTTLVTSTKHSFIPLNTNRPLIIPSISVPRKFSESSLPYGSNQISPPGAFTAGYPRNANSFHTLHSRRGESVDNYAPFHQLPPEAFILPLTRSAAVTTTPFVFSNRLGYELFIPNDTVTSNNTLYENGFVVSSVESLYHNKSVPPTRSDESAPDLHSQLIGAVDNHDVPKNVQNILAPSNNDVSLPQVKSLDHQQLTEAKNSLLSSGTNEISLIPPKKTPGETEKPSSDANTTSTSRFNKTNVPPVERGDLPIDVPRWYPEVTKQISIPLDIEVLHHREEYTPNISNRTEEVHSISSHEVEDRTFLPSANTIIPIPVETYSNGLRYAKEVKLLPQMSSISIHEDFSVDTLKQVSHGTDEKQHKKVQPEDPSKSRFPIYGSDVSNTTLQRTITTLYSPFSNNTETLTSDADSQHVSRKQQNHINQTTHQKSSHDRSQVEGRWTPKRQHFISEGSVPVHDFKIDEGVPSYRKRYPAVTQLFKPEETIGDIGRRPDQQLGSSHQNPFRRRKPSAFRNKTQSVQSRRQQSATPWKKNNHEVPRSFIDKQQTRFGDEGITFHQRGFSKGEVPVTPYGHHRKRFGVLPPGVSVHPRHPQAPYADLALGTIDQTMPVKPPLHPRPSRVHLRHRRRHQRKRNRILPPLDSGLPSSNCCGNDGPNCCSGRRRERQSSKGGCCSQTRESPRPNSVLPLQNDEVEVASKKRAQDVEEDRCMKEKMCRTVYQSAKKVFVCRNIEVDGC